jgi:hypothetical protein
MDTEELAALIAAQLADGRNTTAAAVVRAAQEALAEEVAAYWRSISPHWADHPTHGAQTPTEDAAGHTVDPAEDAYSDSVKAYAKGRRVLVGSPLEPLARWLEYGTSRTPEFGVRARVLAEFGSEAGRRDIVLDDKA